VLDIVQMATECLLYLCIESDWCLGYEFNLWSQTC
jgi:hypothetical protein